MLRDRFHLLHLVGLVIAVGALALLLVTAASGRGSVAPNAQLEAALEKQIAYRARIDFLERVYAPVEDLRRTGKLPAALLRLEEIARDYPGEPHGLMLKGAILYRQGAVQEALASVAGALKADGDYVDANSPLQQRELVTELAERGRATLSERLRAQPGNPALEKGLSDAYYLQSRLAGGCE